MSFAAMSGHGARRLAFALAGLLFLAGCDARIEGDAFLTYGGGDVKPAAGIAVYLIRQDKSRELLMAVFRKKVAAACADYRKTARAELDELGDAITVKFTKDPSAPSCEPYRNEVKRFEAAYKADADFKDRINYLEDLKKKYFRLVVKIAQEEIKNEMRKITILTVKNRSRRNGRKICVILRNASPWPIISTKIDPIVNGIRVPSGSDLARKMFVSYPVAGHFSGGGKDNKKIGGLPSGESKIICARLNKFYPGGLSKGSLKIYRKIKGISGSIGISELSSKVTLVPNRFYVSGLNFSTSLEKYSSPAPFADGVGKSPAEAKLNKRILDRAKSTPEFTEISRKWDAALRKIKARLADLKVDVSDLQDPKLTENPYFDRWIINVQNRVFRKFVNSPYDEVKNKFKKARKRVEICGQIPAAVKKITSSMACSFEDKADTSRRVRVEAATAFVESIMATPSDILKFADDNKLVVRKIETSIKGHFEAKDVKTGAYLVFAEYVTNFVKGFWLKNVQIDDDVKINLTNGSYIGQKDVERLWTTAFDFPYTK